MAEASMGAYGAAIGVAIVLAGVTFALRGKGHPEPLEQIHQHYKLKIKSVLDSNMLNLAVFLNLFCKYMMHALEGVQNTQTSQGVRVSNI